MASLTGARLRAQRLTGTPFATAVDAVRRMGAVQSQDYPGAKWGIAQRTEAVTSAAFDRLYDRGAILRTHVLRPTWHFVLPEDIRWLLRLTGPRVLSGMPGRWRQLGIDRTVVAKARRAWHAALEGGRNLTRAELGAALVAAGISPEGQRLPHLAMALELDGFITSGPLRGRQVTWALLEERVPKVITLEPADALRELTRRYFRSHGPAQLKDFVWWSGLTQADTRRGLALAATALVCRSIDGTDYWFDAELGWRPAGAAAVHLLPNFDEYTVGYRDRSAMLHPAFSFRPDLFAFSSILSNVITAGGELRGAWRRTEAPGGARLELRPLAPLSQVERTGAERVGQRYSRFIERPVEVVWMP
ncbi:MAG: winged helix DNA-binding domain-containing protein [Candidatus Dormibacter sp.]